MADDSKAPDKNIEYARLAERAERYDDMRRVNHFLIISCTWFYTIMYDNCGKYRPVWPEFYHRYMSYLTYSVCGCMNH